MPKQTRSRDAGQTAPGEKTKPMEYRAELRAENMSAKGRKQHAHNAPVRRAASKVRGK
ncbi:MAG TPA: hypothetical protein VIM09_09855 [Chthoniobacterales bacterium]